MIIGIIINYEHKNIIEFETKRFNKRHLIDIFIRYTKKKIGIYF